VDSTLTADIGNDEKKGVDFDLTSGDAAAN
jgi:hypothetical protein